jgi:hypothetical protein
MNRSVAREAMPEFEPDLTAFPAEPRDRQPPRGASRGQPRGDRRGDRRDRWPRRERSASESRRPQHPAQPHRPPHAAQQPRRPARRDELHAYAEREEREAQIREARRLAAQERGEPERQATPRERAKPVAALLVNPRRESD